MELRHLRYFVAVAEELSFRRAAERLHISRPPLTRQIKALEDEVGVRLLERERRRAIRLTDAGRAFLDQARQALQTVEAAGKHARRAATGGDGPLRLAGCPTHSPPLLGIYLPEFHRRHPDVEVSFVAMTFTQYLAALRDGTVHLAFSPDFGEELEPPLRSRLLKTIPLAVALPTRHALARQRHRQVDLQMLRGEVFLRPSAEDAPAYAERLDKIWERTVSAPRNVREVDGFENVLAMVAAGYGVTILSGTSANSPVAGCRVKRLRLPLARYQLRLIWSEENPSLALQNFLTTTREVSLPQTNL